MMTRASHLFEAHLTVADLDRSMAFYRDVVGLPMALSLPERGAAFFWVGDPGRSMLGLWSMGSAPMGMRLHVAFAASQDDVVVCCDRLRAVGVTPLSFFGTETDEPSVIGWMPAAAVYFEDPDGHMLEYLALLDEAPRPAAGIVPWSAWQDGRPQAGRVDVLSHTGAREELRALFEEAGDSALEIDASIDAGEVLVARADGAVVGHVQVIAHGDHSEIKTIAVRDDVRGRGIGRRLVDGAIATARRHRSARLAVATATADIGNLRFYQRCGFRMRSVQRDAFTPASGYADGTILDGIELRDRVWLDLDLAAR